MKRAFIALSVVLVILVAAVVGYGQLRRTHREARQQAAVQAIIDSHSPLENDAGQIDDERRIGHNVHFARVPSTLPPGLVGMEPRANPYPETIHGVYDIYEYDGVEAVVLFSDSTGDFPCGDHSCVRDGAVNVSTPDTSYAYVAVWLTGAAAPSATAIKRFWAKTTWVPIAKAAWFTQLAVVGESRW